MTGPLLRYCDLSQAERSLLDRDVVSRILGGTDSERLAVTLGVFHSWGVMCPHPIRTRLYEGLYGSIDSVPFDECSWYSCGACGSIVINR